MVEMEARGRSSFSVVSTLLYIGLFVFHPSFASHFGGGVILWRALDTYSGNDMVYICIAH